ncbi:TCP-1/cpn60 chaperonin family protein [Gossypium australe]|uniref:TCP-1/cpn60 chaperonin family protein n=1 Tax=Gossypium australe TaxID=47621 RepID=A0A5B6V4N9_9ROSI|nr:TCP-1/cpn60 chaperonin family protein [Gossypium australe]
MVLVYSLISQNPKHPVSRRLATLPSNELSLSSSLVKRLLEKGHIVHATIRNLGISDNKIYHHHLNLRASVFARRLTRLPSIPKNDAKFRRNVVLRRSRLPKISATKELHFNKDGSAIKKLQTGVNKLADLVGVTLGPNGMNVVLESKYGSPKIVNDGVTVAKEVLSNDNPRYGFNAGTGNYEDLMSAGIIDSTKVVRCCLEHATSVAKTFLMSDCMVVEIKEPEPVPIGNPLDNSGLHF